KAFVMAEFGVTEGFTHTDAVVLNIEEKTVEQGGRTAIPDTSARCPEDILKIITAMEQNMTDLFTGRIQPNSPAVVNADGMLSLSIPAGALPSAADIAIRRVTDTGGLMGWFPGLRLLSPVYDIKLANGIKPVLPVTVNFRLGAGYTADNGNIAFYKLDEETGAWEYIGGSIDINGVISVRLSGFSKYAVIENSDLRLFKDITPGRWSKDPIYSLTYLKIVEGEEQRGTYCFYPERNITRAEFIKMLCASLDLDKLDTNDVKLPFSDTARIPGWAAGYIRPAYKYGLVEGRTDNGRVLADADKNITREEACAILGRTLDISARPGRAYFSDRSSISEYALNYIDVLADMGVVNGNTDNTFRPGSLLTREEAAAIIDRYLKARQARK
ncbi:MAG: S-layer homology domain-containing protein, partial [Clostridiaceae bacterium]